MKKSELEAELKLVRVINKDHIRDKEELNKKIEELEDNLKFKDNEYAILNKTYKERDAQYHECVDALNNLLHSLSAAMKYRNISKPFEPLNYRP